MITSFNKVMINGEVSEKTSNDKGTALKVTISYGWGEYEQEHDINVWCPKKKKKDGSTSDPVAEYVKEGSGLMIEGSLKVNKNGMYLECTNWKFMGGKKKDAPAQKTEEKSFDDSSIPF